ncbi:SagB family peptide dehydrogenase [Catellatospora sichuanensis]|uniref:SagB family peptide dehydrogenase n=1 Tax=Catellatospora sichuanensis TaxID=1969805 RepID=UPI0011820D9E|nr:SagB family peptide dehydrogenase [Catellatospora sichuanensis]
MITLRLDGRPAMDSTATADLMITVADRDPVALHDADGSVAAALRALLRPLTWQQLRDRLALDAEQGDALIRRLLATGVITLGCADEHGDVATARIHSRRADLRPDLEPAADQAVQLSPYALLRRFGDHAVVESARDGTVVHLHRPELAAVAAGLCAPTTPAAAGRLAPGGPQLVRLLAAVGLVAAPGPQPVSPPHAAWTHTRSRSGLVDPRLAAPGTLDEPPAAPAADTDLPLPVPDLAALRHTDPPLADVMESRRSVRRFGRAPLTLPQLGELLYRVARIQQRLDADPAAGRLYSHTLRPAPSAGAMHELDFYLTVRACHDLAPGVYRYLPDRHALGVVTRDTVPLVRMINAAYLAINRESVPPLLISLAARFDRPTRKYGDLAYSLTLRNAGVLLQSVYLSATAMGLGACAVGTGDAADFADATGLDPLEVSSVGEIVIGSLPGQDE